MLVDWMDGYNGLDVLEDSSCSLRVRREGGLRIDGLVVHEEGYVPTSGSSTLRVSARWFSTALPAP
jgi:hypothetical protein